MNTKRLRKLANFLMTVPKDRFDLGSWIEIGFYEEFTPGCGATACAFGWACTIPEFKKAGLFLKGAIPVLRGFNDQDRYPEGFKTASKFFDISERDALYLFSPDYYPFYSHRDPKRVAARLRAYLQDPTFTWKRATYCARRFTYDTHSSPYDINSSPYDSE